MDSEHSSRTSYLAYMLRLWRAGSQGGHPIWRASLENPHTGELLTFGDTKGLFDFLTEQTTVRRDSAGAPQLPDLAGTCESDDAVRE